MDSTSLVQSGKSMHPGSFEKNRQFVNPTLFKRRRILLIGDDIEFSELLGEVVEKELEIFVDCVPDMDEAALRMNQASYDAVVLDWCLARSLGPKEVVDVSLALEKAEHRFQGPPRGSLPVVVLSAHEKRCLKFIDTSDFRIVGFVSKKQRLQGILDDLKFELDEIFNLMMSA